MAIIENKKLKTSSNRRRIDVGKNCPLDDGLVTVMPQEEFEEYREKYRMLKNENGELIPKEDILPIEEERDQLQEENEILKNKLTNQEKQIEELTSKLKEEQSKDKISEITSIYEDRISDLKEENQRKEEKLNDTIHQVNTLTQKMEKEKEDKIKVEKSFVMLFKDYQNLLNRGLIDRIMNRNLNNTDDYRGLIDIKESYVLDMKKE